MKKPAMKDPRTTRTADLRQGEYSDGQPARRGAVSRVQAHPQARPVHVVQGVQGVCQAGRAGGRGMRRRVSTRRRLARTAAGDPRSPLPRHRRLPALQQRVHPAPAHPLRGRLPRRASRRSSSSSATRTCRQAAELDVRPHIPGDYRIKFKAEALPLKDQLGGYPAAVLAQRAVPAERRRTRATARRWPRLVRDLPGLTALKTRQGRAGRAREPDHRRGGAAGPRHARLRQGRHRQGERGAVAHARRAPAAGRRVRLPGQVRAPRRPARQGARALRAVLHPAAAGAATTGSFSGPPRPAIVYRLKGNPPQAHE